MPSPMSPDLRSTDQIRLQRQHVTWWVDSGLRDQARNQKPGRVSPVIRGKTRQDESRTVYKWVGKSLLRDTMRLEVLGREKLFTFCHSISQI